MPETVEKGGFAVIASFLRRIELFRGLEADDAERLAALFRAQRFDTEETVFHHGEPAAAFYVVRQGGVALFRDQVGKPLQLLSRHHAGDYFGELGLFDGGERKASARATEPSVILAIDRTALIDFLEAHPDVALKLHISAARRHSENVAAVLGVGPRDEVRIRVQRQVTLELEGGGERRAVLENLSYGGMSLRGAPGPWQPLTHVRFTLVFDSYRLAVVGRISWRSGDVLGLAFTDKPPGHGDRIQETLRRLLERLPE